MNTSAVAAAPWAVVQRIYRGVPVIDAVEVAAVTTTAVVELLPDNAYADFTADACVCNNDALNADVTSHQNGGDSVSNSIEVHALGRGNQAQCLIGCQVTGMVGGGACCAWIRHD